MYEDFLYLGLNNLSDSLAVRGLKSTGRKIELVARAYAAVEMNIQPLYSSEELRKKLNEEYAKRIATFGVPDPRSVPINERIHDVKEWPKIDIGIIFAYILAIRDTRMSEHIHSLTVVSWMPF